jgi:DNA-binding LacI/PurR family transcriptional regulator
MLPTRRVHKRVTLTDIARACDVAPSTVSRALSTPGRVSPQMYERISRKAQELGYGAGSRPAQQNRIARGTIALVVPNLHNPFLLDLIRGCQSHAQAAGYLPLLATSGESEQVESDLLEELAETVDGIVLVSPRSEDAVLTVTGQRVPLVVVNRDVPGVSGIRIDTAAGAVQVLDYLVSLGHRRIAYIRGPRASWTDRSRFAALSDRSREHPGAVLLPIGNYFSSLANGRAAADSVALSGASAAMFFNDTLAIGALGRFAELGIDVPGDLSVTGCDDIFGASFTAPPLTTVTASAEEAGRAVTDLLLSRFLSRERPRRFDSVATHLTVRDSTAPPRDADEAPGPVGT